MDELQGVSPDAPVDNLHSAVGSLEPQIVPRLGENVPSPGLYACLYRIHDFSDELDGALARLNAQVGQLEELKERLHAHSLALQGPSGG